ncbi:hypothetical protein D3C73_1458450 [compost metagenome]
MSKQLLVGDSLDHLFNDTCYMMVRNICFQVQNHLSLLVVIVFKGRGKASFGNHFFFHPV